MGLLIQIQFTLISYFLWLILFIPTSKTGKSLQIAGIFLNFGKNFNFYIKFWLEVMKMLSLSGSPQYMRSAAPPLGSTSLGFWKGNWTPVSRISPMLSPWMRKMRKKSQKQWSYCSVWASNLKLTSLKLEIRSDKWWSFTSAVNRTRTRQLQIPGESTHEGLTNVNYRQRETHPEHETCPTEHETHCSDPSNVQP